MNSIIKSKKQEKKKQKTIFNLLTISKVRKFDYLTYDRCFNVCDGCFEHILTYQIDNLNRIDHHNNNMYYLFIPFFFS